MKQGFLTTGQFAKMCKTTKETIYYYTEQGLLHCERSMENGYFYYSYFEYYKYLMISDLKMCDFSIMEIKQYVENISPENNLKYLRQQRERIKKKITDYRKLLKRTEKIIDMTEDAMNLNKELISIITLPEKILFVTEFSNKLSFTASPMEVSNCMNMHSVSCEKDHVEIEYPIHSLLSKDFIEKGICIQHGFGSEITAAQAKKLNDVMIFPEGKYVVAYHYGSYGDLEAVKKTIQDIYQFLDIKKYKITGDGYDYEALSHINSKDFDDFILKFVFPVSEE